MERVKYANVQAAEFGEFRVARARDDWGREWLLAQDVSRLVRKLTETGYRREKKLRRKIRKLRRQLR